MPATSLGNTFARPDDHAREVPRHRRPRVLIAVDGSTPSDWAVQAGGRLAKDLGGRVILFHAIIPDTWVIDVPRMQETLDQEARAEGARLLERAVRLLPEGVEFERMQFEGQPAEEIASAARSLEADFIVMGTRGRNRAAQLLLGSVAEAVVRRAPCPVLTVGHDPASLARTAQANACQTV